MARPCILHSRQYRAVYEGMLNSLSSVLSYRTIASVRDMQCGELCTCAGPLLASPETPAMDPSDAELPEISGIQDADTRHSATEMSDDSFNTVSMRRLEPRASSAITATAQVVAAAQSQLGRLAAKHDELTQVGPAVRRLLPLLERAVTLAAASLERKEEDRKDAGDKRKVGAGGAGAPPGLRAQKQAVWRAAQRRRSGGRGGRYRYMRPPPKPAPPPPRPYAPLRWPPVAVTMGVLKGRLAPLPRSARPPLAGAHLTRWQDEADQQSYMSYSDDDILDIAERFEAKLNMVRGARRSRGGGGGGAAAADGPLGDPKRGPTALRQGRWSGSGPEMTRLLAKAAQLVERKERKAALTHAEARRDSHRCFRAGKSAAAVADLWPYK